MKQVPKELMMASFSVCGLVSSRVMYRGNFLASSALDRVVLDEAPKRIPHGDYPALRRNVL